MLSHSPKITFVTNKSDLVLISGLVWQISFDLKIIWSRLNKIITISLYIVRSVKWVKDLDLGSII